MLVVCCEVSLANLRTSSATTANPRPWSPARAASIAAFNASKLVLSAMPLIMSTISRICLTRSSSSNIDCSFILSEFSNDSKRWRFFSTTPTPLTVCFVAKCETSEEAFVTIAISRIEASSCVTVVTILASAEFCTARL